MFVRNSFFRTESILRKKMSRSSVSLNQRCPCTPLAQKEQAPSPGQADHGFRQAARRSSVPSPVVRSSGKVRSCPSTQPGPRVGFLPSVCSVDSVKGGGRDSSGSVEPSCLDKNLMVGIWFLRWVYNSKCSNTPANSETYPGCRNASVLTHEVVFLG